MIRLIAFVALSALTVSGLGHLNVTDASSRRPHLRVNRQPCRDYSEAVCVGRISPSTRLKQTYARLTATAFINYTLDDVTEELYQTVKDYSREPNCIQNTKVISILPGDLGKQTAYGITVYTAKIHPEAKVIEIRYDAKRTSSTPPSPQFRRHGHSLVRSSYANLPGNIKDFASSYFRTVDFENRFNISEFDVAYEKDVYYRIGFQDRSFKSFLSEEELIETDIRTPKQRNYITHPITYLQHSFASRAYSNLLISSILLKKDPTLVHNPELVAELRTMAKNILEEIRIHIDEVNWISPASKEKLKNIHTLDDFIFGPSEKFLNETMVDTALQFYQDYFRKMRPFMEDIMKSFGYLSVNECKPVYYDRVFRVADAAFRLYYRYDFGHYGDKAPYSLSFFANNAFNNNLENKLVFGYPYIFGYHRRHHTLGYLYGSIGRVIAHEIFHSYGVRRILTDGVKDVFDNRIYQSGISCVRNYYGSFAHPQFGAPNGTLKANEGFADLHAARAIYGLVTRGNLMDYNSTHQSPIRNIHAVVRGVFYGMAGFDCDAYLNERANPELERANLLNIPHPRSSIRMNAIFKQLPVFTKMFRCKPGDANYRADNLCNAFPTIRKPKLFSFPNRKVTLKAAVMSGLLTILLLSTAIAFGFNSELDFLDEGLAPWDTRDILYSGPDPCDDVSKFVCSKQSLSVKLQEEYQKRIDYIFKDYPLDDVTKELYDSLKDAEDETKNCNWNPVVQEGRGKAAYLGYLAAYGLGDILARIRVGVKVIEVRARDMTIPRQEHDTITTRFRDLPRDMRVFVSTFFGLLDFENRFDIDDFDVIYEKGINFDERAFKSLYSDGILPSSVSNNVTNSEKNESMIMTFQKSKFLGAYTNLLISSVLLKVDPKLVHDRDLVGDLRAITKNILSEIERHFEEITWISQESKDKLKNLHTIDDYIFGPSEKFLNQTMVDTALKFFQEFFRKSRPFSERNMKKLGVPLECKVPYYEAMFRMADQAFQLYYDYDFEHYKPMYDAFSFYDCNAYNALLEKKLVFGLPMIYGYRRHLPLGYLYGSVGLLIAHETFHSYGTSQINVNGVDDVFSSSIYQSSISCIKDYYGSFVDSKFGKPNGTRKANEGFADLHAGRTIVRLIKRGNLRHTWLSLPAVRKDLKDAFLGIASFDCESYRKEQEDDDYRKKSVEKIHPRSSIRMNAILKQMPEFTELYHCQPGDRNYRTEEICDAFPVHHPSVWFQK
ncbi:hypothetical protein QR680_006957 [Steinernema hermaphroditum]|uniref:Peptidase M13 C-terminal domain-containing protein n=1 Tax=Steinernema hermaphroditum TaxID=289476 RepID=A0AA39LY93_9BILA|nr:hypothetical protein QR680_006957 [Steinernema hermaphroditum]